MKNDYFLEIMPLELNMVELGNEIKTIKKFYSLKNSQVPAVPHISLTGNFDIVNGYLDDVQMRIAACVRKYPEQKYSIRGYKKHALSNGKFMVAYDIEFSKNLNRVRNEIVNDIADLVQFEYPDFEFKNQWYHITIASDLEEELADSIMDGIIRSGVDKAHIKCNNPMYVLVKNGNNIAGFSKRKRAWCDPTSFIKKETKVHIRSWC